MTREGGVAGVVAQFNARVPIGTPVAYWPGARGGAGAESVTRSRAWLLGDHTPVVMVEGYPGGIALTHVMPIPPGQTPTHCPPHAYGVETLWNRGGSRQRWGMSMEMADVQQPLSRIDAAHLMRMMIEDGHDPDAVRLVAITVADSEATNEAMEYGEECEEECAPEATPEEVAAYARDEALGDEHDPEFAQIAAKAAADRRRRLRG